MDVLGRRHGLSDRRGLHRCALGEPANLVVLEELRCVVKLQSDTVGDFEALQRRAETPASLRVEHKGGR